LTDRPASIVGKLTAKTPGPTKTSLFNLKRIRRYRTDVTFCAIKRSNDMQSPLYPQADVQLLLVLMKNALGGDANTERWL